MIVTLVLVACQQHRKRRQFKFHHDHRTFMDEMVVMLLLKPSGDVELKNNSTVIIITVYFRME